MTLAKTIAFARTNLDNPSAYARVMSSAIRSAMSDRAATTLRAAVMIDGMVDHFAGWSTDCPTAR